MDIAVSWNQFRVTGGRAGTSLECNLLRWQHMMLSVLEALDGEPATLFAEYEAVTGDPPGQARRLAVFLDQQCDAVSGEATVASMAGVCEPGLRRNRDGQRHAVTGHPAARVYRDATRIYLKSTSCG